MTKSTTRTKADVAGVVGRKNLIINGGFDVWQRGTSFTNGYTADRFWTLLSGGTSTISRQAFTAGQTEVPNNPTYYLQDSTSVGATNCGISSKIEYVATGSGQNVTVSFWAKGVNPARGSFDLLLIQRFGTGGSASVVLTTSVTLNSSWTKHSHTFTVPSIAGKTIGDGNNLDLFIRQGAADAGTAAWELNVANVQLELGSVATDFEHRSYGEELALCQRYYQQSYEAGVVAGSVTTTGAFHYRTGATANQYETLELNTPMRSQPSLAFYGTSAATNSIGKWRGSSDVAYTVGNPYISASRFTVNFAAAGNIFISGHYTADAEL